MWTNDPQSRRGGNLLGGQHGSGNFQERFDLDIPHQQDVLFIIEDGDGNNPVEFLDLPDNLDILFIRTTGDDTGLFGRLG